MPRRPYMTSTSAFEGLFQGAKRVVWLTDIHLNFLTEHQVDSLLAEVRAQTPDAVLISGDIAEAPTLESALFLLDRGLRSPVYFVLGNQDYYHGSIASVRELASEITHEAQWLRYLPRLGVVELTADTALIGHDGWADGGLGSFEGSAIMPKDYGRINELRDLNASSLRERLEHLAAEAVAYVRQWLPVVFRSHAHAILLTHVPPFREACWNGDAIGDDNFLPHYASHALGVALREIMLEHPENALTVLCGHTHSPARAEILDNLLVLAGKAEYGVPRVERVFEVA